MAAGMIHIGLFDGIGGFGMAAAWCGIETVVSCEIGAFGSDVLASLFPAAYHHKDIRTLTKTIIDERLIPRFGANYGRRTILTGGFPCQPFSMAGRRRGAADDRYLWPEMLRIIGDVRPRWVIGENVAGILSMVQPVHVATLESEPDLFGAGNELQTECGQYTVHRICKDFEAIGYTIRPVVIPACAVGAPHRRDRVWFLASDAAAEGDDWRTHCNPASASASNATGEPRGSGDECKQQENGSEKRASYLEEVVAGFVVRAGVSGIFRMNHRFALEMMGYAPNHCAAGYERILRNVCQTMSLRKPFAAPINDSTRKR